MPMNLGQSVLSNTLFCRRAFMTLVGGALASAPISPFAQETPLVGVLIGLSNDAESQARLKAFTSGLAEQGWSVGKNLRVEYRFSESDFQRMQAFAKELATLRPNCILGHSTPVVRALMQATRTIPIVFVAVQDPVGSGFVASIPQPGGNVTGFMLVRSSITGKYLSLLRELIPQLAHVALVYNPDSVDNKELLTNFIETAKQFKIEPIINQVRSQADIEISMAQLAERQSIAFVLLPDNFVSFHRHLFVSLSTRYRIPAIYPYRYFVEEGGLLSYGVDVVDLFRRSADYVSRIIRGASPANLPVQAPTKFELAINLKTAKDIGLVVPRNLLFAADSLVE
jgi:putative ABC transport system substrate-binding protein